MKIGILIAIQDEINAFVKGFDGTYSVEKVYDFNVYKVSEGDNEIFAIHCGAGQIYAAAATMLLIDRYGVEMMINYGIVGALREGLRAKELCLVDKIVHYCFDTSAIDNCEVGRHVDYDDLYLHPDRGLLEKAKSLNVNFTSVTCASGESFIDPPEERLALGKEFKADICEMEAAAVFLTADKAGVPSLFIKAISDSLYGGADEYYETGEDGAAVCVKVVKEILSI